MNIYGVVSNFVDSQMADIPLAVLGSERRSQIVFFRKVFLKSDTAVALRRSLFNSVNNTCIFYQCLL